MQRIYQRARHKFALPHEFNALYHQNPKPLINALFASVSQTLAEFAANPKWMGGWGQTGFQLGAAHLESGLGFAHSPARLHGLQGAGPKPRSVVPRRCCNT